MNNSSVSLSNGFQNATNLTVTAIKNNLFADRELLVYPNPTSSDIIIENKSNKNNLSYKMFSINGNELKNANLDNQAQQIINVNTIANGLYILEIKDNNTQQVQSYKIEKINN